MSSASKLNAQFQTPFLKKRTSDTREPGLNLTVTSPSSKRRKSHSASPVHVRHDASGDSAALRSSGGNADEDDAEDEYDRSYGAHVTARKTITVSQLNRHIQPKPQALRSPAGPSSRPAPAAADAAALNTPVRSMISMGRASGIRTPKSAFAQQSRSSSGSSELTKRNLDSVDRRESAAPTAAGGSSKTSAPAAQDASAADEYWICQWRKPQARKHKTWDGDAVLIVKADRQRCSLRCMDTWKELATNVKFDGGDGPLNPGDGVKVGGNEVEIERAITAKQYSTGKFSEAPKPPKPSSFVAATSSSPLNLGPASSTSFYAKPPPKPQPKVAPLELKPKSTPAKPASSKPKSKEQTPAPVVRPTGLANPHLGKAAHPRYDPAEPGAIVMRRPGQKHQKRYNRHGLHVVDVVVEPKLGQILRPHQVEGVRWLYEKVLGLCIDDKDAVEDDDLGAILADEMGLGKTIQTIALVQTLLKQSCYYTNNPHTVERVLIVCPLSVVPNWKREFRKWVGANGLNVMCVDGKDSNKVERFLLSSTYQVLVIGYEKLRTCMDLLAKAQPPIGLIVCDEGHRLKSKDAKTTKMFEALKTPRRVILSGTPVQNDLSEFYAMVNFVKPNFLDTYSRFKKIFEDPIVNSRKQNATKEQRDLGRQRSEQLALVTKNTILRRSADLLNDYLQPKVEQVVFCSPTPLQLSIYRHVLGSSNVRDVLRGRGGSSAFTLIGLLRKLCNTPELLLKDLAAGAASDKEASVTAGLLEGASHLFPEQRIAGDMTLSGKLIAVAAMLKHIRETTDDKVVLVSNFTATLDVLESFCKRLRYSFLRLDGKTKQDARMDLVNDFNRSNAKSSFVFLLSAKAGGQGINLIGANRLILLDSDWNPSTDKQAMARIHRDGQKKRCFIYRMLLSGSMDEKIYQRQISKIGLSDALMDEAGTTSKASDSYSVEDLRDIFSLHTDTPCVSHDRLGCTCGGNGVPGAGLLAPGSEADEESDEELVGFVTATQENVMAQSRSNKDNRAKLAALHEWSHHDTTPAEGGESAKALADDVLRSIIVKQKGAPAEVEKEKQPAAKPPAGKSPSKANAQNKSPSKAAASKSPSKPPSDKSAPAAPAEKMAPPAFTQTPSPPAAGPAAPKSLLAEIDLEVCAAKAAEEASQRRRAEDLEQALREAVVCKHSKTAKKKIRDAYGLDETRDERGGKKARKPVPLPTIQYPRALDDVAPEELEEEDEEIQEVLVMAKGKGKQKEQEKAKEVEVVELEEDVEMSDAREKESAKAKAQDEDVEMADAAVEKATTGVQLNRDRPRRLSDVTRSVATEDEWEDEANAKETCGGKRFDVTQHAPGSILYVYSKSSVASSAPTPEM